MRVRAGGWAARYPEYRRENIYLIKARAAAAADPKVAVPLWNEANANWQAWAAEYLGAVNQMNRPLSLNKQKAEKVQARIKLIGDLKDAGKPDYKDLGEKAQKDLEAAEKAGTPTTAIKYRIAAIKEYADKKEELDWEAEEKNAQAELAVYQREIGEAGR